MSSGLWLTVFALGAYHGMNPGMGWLFAVALGLQEKSRQAVARALVPIAVGHGFSVALVLAALAFLQATLWTEAVRPLAAMVLIGFGVFRVVSSRHPRWASMRVGFRDLTLWSFLMASSHGAGLMLVPVLLARPAVLAAHHPMTAVAPIQAGAFPLLLGATAVHTLGLLLVTSIIALLFYQRLGLGILRRTWFNFDRLWAFALCGSGVLALAL